MCNAAHDLGKKLAGTSSLGAVPASVGTYIADWTRRGFGAGFCRQWVLRESRPESYAVGMNRVVGMCACNSRAWAKLPCC